MLSIPEASTANIVADSSEVKSNRFGNQLVRKNGLEPPYSKDQAIACVGHVVSALCFYVACAMLLAQRPSKNSQDSVMVVSVPLNVTSNH